MRASSVIIASAFVLLAMPVSAQKGAKIEIDLDGRGPFELLQDWNGGQRVLYWSSEDQLWVELFEAQSISGLADDANSRLKQIVSGGRHWQWRNTGYVPLVAQPAVPAGPTTEADFAAAIEHLHPDLGEPVQNSAANTTYQMQASTAGPVKAVALASTVLCQEGGAVCPVVLFSGGVPTSHTYLSQEDVWGLTISDGLPVLEVQQPASLLQIDVTTGAERELPQFAPRAAEDAPNRPRHIDDAG